MSTELRRGGIRQDQPTVRLQAPGSIEWSMSTNADDEAIDFDGHPGVPAKEILVIIEGYSAGEPPTERIIVVLKGGALLHLEASEANRAAVGRWNAWRRAPRHSG